tara:strand:+ start:208 stop:630 length:423 start_codon:yes stop_codon:yes gene_type:complete
MIKYNLKCHKDHEFESWFSNSEEFEKLSKKNFLECIYCSSKKITKSIMAPMVSSSKEVEEQIGKLNINFQNEKNKLLKLRNYIENNFEFVGKDFSKRVREVYYDKKSKKAIYGTTTKEEKEELAEEGISLLSIPWINKDN